MRRSLVAPLSAILRSPSTGLVCHSPEMNWETVQRLKTTQMAATSRSDLHFGPAQNEHPGGPNLRSLAPSGQLSARSTGPQSKKAVRPAVNVKACDTEPYPVVAGLLIGRSTKF